MKIVWVIAIAILTFLAVSSGITKVLLLPQDVEFFGKYGFSTLLLMAYGVVQLIGGVLLPFRQTRFVGAAIVAITFLLSLVLLLIEGNLPVSLITAIAILVLGWIMQRSRPHAAAH